MATTNKDPFNVKLDKYEQEIEDQMENAQRLSPEEEQKEIAIAQQAVNNTKFARK